jgi:hypothetical protein
MVNLDNINIYHKIQKYQQKLDTQPNNEIYIYKLKYYYNMIGGISEKHYIMHKSRLHEVNLNIIYNDNGIVSITFPDNINGENIQVEKKTLKIGDTYQINGNLTFEYINFTKNGNYISANVKYSDGSLGMKSIDFHLFDPTIIKIKQSRRQRRANAINPQVSPQSFDLSNPRGQNRRTELERRRLQQTNNNGNPIPQKYIDFISRLYTQPHTLTEYETYYLKQINDWFNLPNNQSNKVNPVYTKLKTLIKDVTQIEKQFQQNLDINKQKAFREYDNFKTPTDFNNFFTVLQGKYKDKNLALYKENLEYLFEYISNIIKTNPNSQLIQSYITLKNRISNEYGKI